MALPYCRNIVIRIELLFFMIISYLRIDITGFAVKPGLMHRGTAYFTINTQAHELYVHFQPH